MTELSDAEGLELLLAAETAGMGFSGFTTGELQTLARHMAFVELEVDERILEAGERASFAAIVLCGSLELVGAQPNVRKRSVFQGQFVGDRAYFEGGKRDAHCYSRSEGTVIVVLKYTAIHQLALTEVGIRLVRMLGATSAALVTQGIQQEAADKEDAQKNTTYKSSIAEKGNLQKFKRRKTHLTKVQAPKNAEDEDKKRKIVTIKGHEDMDKRSENVGRRSKII